MLKQNKPIPQPTKDLLHAIYLLQNPDLTPKDACELLEEVSEYGELITLLDFRAIDSSNTQIALLIDDTELHEPAVISRLQAHRFVRDLKNAL